METILMLDLHVGCKELALVLDTDADTTICTGTGAESSWVSEIEQKRRTCQ
jgi:hypothetical protein